MTDISTRSERRRFGLRTIQRRRKLALLGVALVIGLGLPFFHSFSVGEGLVHEIVEVLGILMIGAAIVGRTWCTLYIGGRKLREVVALGPYSVSRNPLYLFSFIGVAGIGAQTGSILLGPLFVLMMLAIFLPVVRSEEAALADRFGAQYATYKARVPRFWPRLSEWRDAETVTVMPRLVLRTSLEVFLFLLVIPFTETVEWLQETGYVTPLLHLP